MKRHKLNMTRPEFLLKFLTRSEDPSKLTEEDMEKVLPGQSKLIYVSYTAIIESDLDKSKIKAVNCDGETVALQLTSKALAKEVKEECNKEEIRFGCGIYKIKVKVDGANVFVSAEYLRSVQDDLESD